jgi:hypothetical protein
VRVAVWGRRKGVVGWYWMEDTFIFSPHNTFWVKYGHYLRLSWVPW